ncbi:ATP-dependent helicase/nuclease subunit A [Methanofollis sp. W23]|uniref:UvrD-helicase domain-containing protein n=1 Tax=Methanofollis sp. W23 TaxID=2817849 RepID=UPI001AE5BD43|nr:UvrD-helicase domain-containing protein [Methanofollis sp. W23]MBP2145422.1 ATP-dependent helicase/nuclease subunit A [Methanofollis sp. W23]
MALTERQEEAALHHDQSICVTAGAGTGKTHVLVTKYIDLLKTEACGVREILALTYTDNAAAEMKERVRIAIDREEGERWGQIRDDFSWASISTFHAFCTGCLHEFPLEAGVDPACVVLDERQARQIRDEVIEGLVYGEPPEQCRAAVIRTLRALGASGLEQCLLRLYNKRETAGEFFAALGEDDGMVLDAWETRIRAAQAEAFAAFMEDTHCQALVETLCDLAARYPGDADPAMRYLRAVEPLLPVRDAPGIAAVAGVNATFKRGFGQKKNWDEDDLVLVRATFDEFKTAIESYAEICTLSVERDDPFTQTALDFFADLGTVFSTFLDRYNAGKRRLGGLDFSDLIHSTYRLFCEHDHLVAEHFRTRYRYILVDEFQDTDPVQTTILRRILGDLVQEQEHLFIVGDPKQSIYLFRDADVTLFKRAREAIETDLGGREVSLDVNFRSTPQVVGFVNAVFSALMAGASKPWEFRYDPLRACRQDEGSVELLLAPADKDTVTAKKNEAEMVAQKVADLVGTFMVYPDREAPRPAAYGDVAILLERRTNLAYYERALRAAGVPYHVHSGLGFYARQEVYDLYNLLCVLDNGLDDVALYGVLRSPYFGISDADLFRMAGAAPLRDRLYDYAAEHPTSDLAAAAALLETWARLARRVPVPFLLGRVLDDSGIYAVYGGMPDGAQCLANVEKFVGMTRAAGEVSLAAWVAELKRCIEEEEKEGEAHLDPTATDAVSIMTVHAAKGLEFPVVIVPGLAEEPPSNSQKIFIEDRLLMGAKIPDPARDFTPQETPVYTLLKMEHEQKLVAERLRLFYVAVTRARDHLVLSGVRPEELGTPLPSSPTRMDWLCSAVGLSEEEVEAGGTEVGGVTLTITAALPGVEAEETGVAGPIVLPSGDLPSGGPASIVVAEEERPYSVSEIERYLACPRAYEEGKEAAGRRARGPQPPGWATTKGLILHEVLRGRDPAAVCARYGVDDQAVVTACEEIYTRFMASPLMAGALADHCEVPFRVRLGGVLFKGAIDRLVRTAGGEWVLIDYKTGRVREEAVPAKVDEYAMQMVVYRDAAEAILGQRVRPLLYFTHLDRFVAVEVDEEAVRARTVQAVEAIEAGRFCFVECEGCDREGECPCLLRIFERE